MDGVTARRLFSLVAVVVMTLSAPTDCAKPIHCADNTIRQDCTGSAGNNQPPPQCSVGQIQIQPVAYQVAAPEVHEYFIMVDLEDEDCDGLNLKNKAHIERSGAYQNREGKTAFMVWDDGKSGIVNTELPYHTTGVIEKSRPHNVGVIATMAVTVEMIKAGAAWLECRIERDHSIVNGMGEVGLHRVPITGPGPYVVQCRAFR